MRDQDRTIPSTDGTELRWCMASGSQDAYRILPHADEVRCFVCGRYLFLTVHLRLPRHLVKERVA